MTDPKIATISRGGSRFHVSPTDGSKVPGVTSVVGMLPKGFLGPWNAKLVAETAVENLGEVVGIAMRDRQAAIDFLKGAPRRFTSKAADVGTDAHDIFEKMAGGASPGRLHPELKVYADHFGEFLDEFQPEFLHLEQTVWSDTHSYAGSFDAVMKIGGEVVGADWKTTRSGVHAEVAIQLSAYRYADYILNPEGGEDLEIPAWDGGAVLHVRPEGWKLVPVKCDEEIFEYFLKLRAIFDWDKDVRGTVIGDPINTGAAKPKRPVRRKPAAA